jgi:hypothetical protein
MDHSSNQHISAKLQVIQTRQIKIMFYKVGYRQRYKTNRKIKRKNYPSGYYVYLAEQNIII